MTIGVGGLAALISSGPDAETPKVKAEFASPHAAHRAGVQSLAQGEVGKALPALEFAADRGVLGAQFRLARLYSAEGEHRDDAKALTYYHMIVNGYGGIDRLHPASRHVAQAMRKLSRYYREGVPEIGLQPDPRRAAQIMRDAASYFRDPSAQFQIGRMYAEGDGVARSQRLAASWLLKASQKRYAPAQAYLGEMLWQANANDRLRAQGLALLALAVDNAGAARREQIEARYRAVGQDAEAAVIQQAERFVGAWDSFRTSGALQTATAKLRSLRSTPLEAAPVGSLVVSVNDEDYAGEGAVSTLMRDIRLYLPYDMANQAGSPEANLAPHPMEKFVRGQPSLQADDTSDDITTVEINRYGGEMLSVGVEVPTQ
jgi:hypothetical protein